MTPELKEKLEELAYWDESTTNREPFMAGAEAAVLLLGWPRQEDWEAAHRYSNQIATHDSHDTFSCEQGRLYEMLRGAFLAGRRGITGAISRATENERYRCAGIAERFHTQDGQAIHNMIMNPRSNL